MCNLKQKLNGDRGQQLLRFPYAALVMLLMLFCSASCTNSSSHVPEEGPPKLSGGTSSAWWNTREQKLNIPPTTLLPQSEDFLAERSKLPNDPATPTPRSTWNWNWLRAFDLSNLIQVLGLVLLLVAIGILFYVLRNPAVAFIRRRRESEDRTMREIVKVADLPFEVEASEEGFVASAEKHARRGDYNLAVIYLFSFILVELDHHSHLALRRGKTNRMYLRELRSRPEIADGYRTIMLAFECAFFGQHKLSAEDYTQCQNAADRIKNLIQSSVAPKAAAVEKAVAISAILAVTFSIGCSRLPTEEYGDLTMSANNSLASYTAFRALFESTGRRAVTTDQLTPRMDRFGSIVWTPDNYEPPTPEECAWIDDWLTRNAGSTFIYVGRDYNPGQDYWRDVSEAAVDNRAAPYLTMAAQSQSQDFSKFLNNAPLHPKFSRWFIQENSGVSHRKVVGTPTSALSYPVEQCTMSVRTKLTPISSLTPEELKTKYPQDLQSQVEAEVNARADQLYKSRVTDWEQTAGEDFDPYEGYDEDEYEPLEVPTPNEEPANETSDVDAPSIEELAEIKYEELLEREENYSPSNSAVPAESISDEQLQQAGVKLMSYMKSEVLLQAEDGTPLVYEITDERWARSRLIVVTNGSLCCNYALANAQRRQTAMALIDRTAVRGRVAFMSEGNPFLRYASPDSRDPFGFSLFLIYPLNIILAHALLLGLVAMIALWPIFGRPHLVVEKGISDFGKHVEAFGMLLLQTRDKAFALHNIARYHREVKRDTNSKWASADQPSVNDGPPKT